MTVPSQYARASQEFDRFLSAAQQALDHTSSHQTYQTVESMLRVFRRWLTVEQAIEFANALPAVLRAIFVADWRLDEPRRPFAPLAELNREVHEFRKYHDFSPGNAIETIAPLVRAASDPVHFDRVLPSLPEKRQRSGR